MKAIIVSIIASLGAIIANTASAGCVWGWIDEPEMPKSMLER